MTYEEAKQIKREALKTAIKWRLHKYNPNKYPTPPRPSGNFSDQIAEYWIACQTVIAHEQGPMFDNDNIWFKFLKGK